VSRISPAPATPARLVAHLNTRLGAWPPQGPLTVAGSPARLAPGWDGQVERVLGVGREVGAGGGAVLSVPPGAADAVRALGEDLHAPGYAEGLAAVLGPPPITFGWGVYRWSVTPTPGEDPGRWLPRSDPRVPLWLQPFNGEVCVALDGGGRYVAGVGLKRHDADGWEIAVGTAPEARRRGLARGLVAQAARAVLAAGAIPLYLHDRANTASARTAEAAGFPDRGWRVYAHWTPPA